MKNKYLKFIFWFLMGALCFWIFQPLTRIPLINVISRKSFFLRLSIKSPWIVWIFLGLTAGLFEEIGRFLFKLILDKNGKDYFQPLIFGIGHALGEIAFLFTLVPIQQLSALAYVERFIAVFLHIGMTVIVWNGFVKNQRLKYLCFSIIVHTIIDSSIGLMQYLDFKIIQIEFAFFIEAVLLMCYVFYSKKYYKGENYENQ